MISLFHHPNYTLTDAGIRSSRFFEGGKLHQEQNEVKKVGIFPLFQDGKFTSLVARPR